MSETSALRTDMLKPHGQAFLDEVKRAGPGAASAAGEEVKAKLPDELAKFPGNLRAEQLRAELAAYASRPKFEHVASCDGLYTLSAVAYQIYQDTGDVGYLLDSADAMLAALAQGC